MGNTRTYDTIVLRTYDVGEADRFCILLTRERGRIAARARGVRKLTSRIGGSLLPFRRVQADVHEGSGGFLVTTTHAASMLVGDEGIHTVSAAQQGVELLQHLLQDDEAVPEVFDITSIFLAQCRNGDGPILAFTVRLLAVLGVFPTREQEWRMPAEGTAFLQVCTGTGEWWRGALPPAEQRRGIERLCRELRHMQNPGSGALQPLAVLASA